MVGNRNCDSLPYVWKKIKLETIAVVDFETTGLSPQQGARATEIAVILLTDGQVVDYYQSLMNAGAWIPPNIEMLTGITNQMILAAPPAEKIMREVDEFVGDALFVAHNASFDRRFWDYETSKIGRRRRQEFACTLLLARRMYRDSPNYKLGTLAKFHQLPDVGPTHRAHADALLATHLYKKICLDVKNRYGLSRVDHSLLIEIQNTQAALMDQTVARRSRLPTEAQTQKIARVGAEKLSRGMPSPSESFISSATVRITEVQRPVTTTQSASSFANSASAVSHEKKNETKKTGGAWLWWVIAFVIFFLFLKK